jgi:hypothetical protein
VVLPDGGCSSRGVTNGAACAGAAPALTADLRDVYGAGQCFLAKLVSHIHPYIYIYDAVRYAFAWYIAHNYRLLPVALLTLLFADRLIPPVYTSRLVTALLCLTFIGILFLTHPHAQTDRQTETERERERERESDAYFIHLAFSRLQFQDHKMTNT